MKTTDSMAAGAWNADRERDAETGPMKTEGLTRSVHGDKGLTAGLLWWPAGCSQRSTQHRGPRMSDMNGTNVKKHWQDLDAGCISISWNKEQSWILLLLDKTEIISARVWGLV